MPCRLDGRRILYLGGRKNVLPHLKSAAEAREAILLVHDGGMEDSAHRIEELVGGCDAVVCPIDCVSHGACKLAKVLCRRFNKPFLPIPTASRSGFERALDQLAAGGGESRRGVRRCGSSCTAASHMAAWRVEAETWARGTDGSKTGCPGYG